MAGYFSHLFHNHSNHKNSVLSVPDVPDDYNTSISAGFLRTPKEEHQQQTEKRCSSHSVPMKASVYEGYSAIRTPEHREHHKNSHTEYGTEYYQERAAIQEYDGGFSREEAEKATLLLWIHDHSISIAEGLCASCGKPIISEQESIQYGKIRLHWDGGDKDRNIHCYRSYIKKRMPEAKKALGMNNTPY